MSDADTYYEALTPDEFINQAQSACYAPPSRALFEATLQRYADMVDADTERANLEDAAAAAAPGMLATFGEANPQIFSVNVDCALYGVQCSPGIRPVLAQDARGYWLRFVIDKESR